MGGPHEETVMIVSNLLDFAFKIHGFTLIAKLPKRQKIKWQMLNLVNHCESVCIFNKIFLIAKKLDEKIQKFF